jgi:GPH family glycoside/pentoside/hexuronide:cation symporter
MTKAPALSIPVPLAEVRPLPWSTKLLYGIGEIPMTVTMVLFGLFALFFYNSVMGLPGPLVGIGVAAGLVVDALLDPYIGYRSDRLQSRFGRRHVLMFVGTLAMGPCFFLLFSPPRGLGTSQLFLWLLMFSVLFRATSAVYRIPYMSLGAELSQDYAERTVVIAVRSLMGLLGTLAAAGLSFLLFFPPTANGTDPKLNYSSYTHLGAVFGAVMSLAGLVTCGGTLAHRNIANLVRVAPSATSFFSGFRLSMRNRDFRSLWCSFTLFFLAVVLNACLSIQYFTWYAQIHAGKTLSAIQVSFYLGALAGVLFWLGMAKRGEKHKLYLGSIIGLAALLCLATALIGEGRFFGAGNATPLLVGHVAGGLLASALWVIPASMVADLADHDELVCGVRREGIYFGILSLGEKTASGGALLAAGVLLNSFVRLAPASPVQTVGAVARLGMLYGVVPGVLLVGAAMLILPYKLDRRAVRETQEKLATRKQEVPGG